MKDTIVAIDKFMDKSIVRISSAVALLVISNTLLTTTYQILAYILIPLSITAIAYFVSRLIVHNYMELSHGT